MPGENPPSPQVVLVEPDPSAIARRHREALKRRAEGRLSKLSRRILSPVVGRLADEFGEVWYYVHLDYGRAKGVCTSKGEIRSDRILVNEIDTAANYEERGLATLLLSSLEEHFHLRAIPEEVADYPQALPFWRKYLGEKTMDDAGRILGFRDGRLWVDFGERIDELRSKKPELFESLLRMPARSSRDYVKVELEGEDLWARRLGRSRKPSALAEAKRELQRLKNSDEN